MAQNKLNITPFDGTNFHVWKFRVEKILDEYGVLSCVKEDVDEDVQGEVKKDKKAMSLIVQCLADSQMELVMNKKNAFDMWRSLGTVYEKKGLSGQLGLKKKLMTLKMKETNKLEDLMQTFEEVVR